MVGLCVVRLGEGAKVAKDYFQFPYQHTAWDDVHEEAEHMRCLEHTLGLLEYHLSTSLV